MEFTKEQLEKASEAKSAEELISMAEAEGFTITKEQAKIFLCKGKEGELAEEELNNVAGGTCYSKGVTDPHYHEWRQYAIVSPLNICPRAAGWHCSECTYSFIDGITWYCERRWNTKDGEVWRD